MQTLTVVGRMIDTHSLFINRTHHCIIEVGSIDSLAGSRVGGAPPLSLAASQPTCPMCAGGVEYVLTLSGDVLTDTISRGRALSVLVCRDIMCRMKSFRPMQPSSLLLAIHEDEGRASITSNIEGMFEGRRLVLGETRLGGATCDDSALGGLPGYIQPRGAIYDKELSRKGFAFLAQWSEVCLPRTMKRGEDPFLFGSLYLFARCNAATLLPELQDVIGFWQNS